MGKAWNSGVKKPAHEKQIIFKRWNNGAGRLEYFTLDGATELLVLRSWAEHQVVSGAARYVEVAS